MRSVLSRVSRLIVTATLVVGVASILLGCSADSKLQGSWITGDGTQKVTFSSDGWFRQVTIDPTRPAQVNLQSKFLVTDATTLEMTSQDGALSLFAIAWEGNDKVNLNVAGGSALTLMREGSQLATDALEKAEAEAAERKTAKNAEENLPSTIESYYGSLQRHDYVMAFANSPQIEQSNEFNGDFGSVRQADYDVASFSKERVWSEGADAAYALYWVSDSSGNRYQDKWTYRFEPWKGWRPVAREDTGEKDLVSPSGSSGSGSAPTLTQEQLDGGALPQGHGDIGGMP